MAEVESERQIPRVLVEEIEDVLVLAGSRGGPCDAGKLSVDPIEHFYKDRDEHTHAQPSRVIQRGDHEPEQTCRQGDPVGGNPSAGEAANQKVFEGWIEILRGQLEGAFL